jgi:uroporphyrinogen-III synthase
MRVPTQRVRELRHDQTDAERTAWHLLRGRKLGAKFRRQCRLENWVVDFYCFEHRLAIELDGGVHSQPSKMRKDAAKEDYLRTTGIRLLHIPNGLVIQDPKEFLRKVREGIPGGYETTPHPSRSR